MRKVFPTGIWCTAVFGTDSPAMLTHRREMINLTLQKEPDSTVFLSDGWHTERLITNLGKRSYKSNQYAEFTLCVNEFGQSNGGSSCSEGHRCLLCALPQSCFHAEMSLSPKHITNVGSLPVSQSGWNRMWNTASKSNFPPSAQV